MIPLTNEEKVSMSLSALMTYAELLNELKQEVKKIKSEE